MDIAMSDAALKLDTLPTELLHRIASYLPCSSILPLCFTSRILYSSCYDKIVFKHSSTTVLYDSHYYERMRLDDVEVEDWELESCASEASAENSEDEEWDPSLFEDEWPVRPRDEWDHGNWGPKEVLRRSEEAEAWYGAWPDAAVYDRLQTADCAKIALAVEKARKLFPFVDEDNELLADFSDRDRANKRRVIEEMMKVKTTEWTGNWKAYNARDWLPQLIALGHPSVIHMQPEHLQLLLWHTNQDDEIERNPSLFDYCTVGFCMTALQLLQIELRPAEPNFPTAAWHLRGTFSNAHPEGMCDIEMLHQELCKFEWNDVDFDFTDRWALLLYMTITVYPHSSASKIRLPVLHRMPITQVLGCYPMPFSTPADTLMRSHLDAGDMVRYLAGDWLGFHTTNTEDDRDPPLNIHRLAPLRLVAKEPIPGDDTVSADTIAIIDLASRGRDSEDHFNLQGTVSATGEFVAVKTGGLRAMYQRAGERSRFRGVVTPFGVVGLWESSEVREHSTYRDPFGFFWIWKAEWCLDA
ncbi:hypothetical protein BDV95DRAFT_563481 [Massariosphaeria phaeospora]|uniref:F-box domain-containing protein n=1 Tax=Massariosphaeria phaeospora TaxID=100035 RepID=A0A7C8MGF4_9PLEO|nr:hypothetical protein BDV95DRAFT_563481 [Massariosphaeria phaeospora]